MVEKPSIRKAFLANVPHAMSEQQFWERFVKHEYSKKASRKRELGEGVANIPNEDSHLFSSASELLPSMVKRMKRMDPSLNIFADANSQQPWSLPTSTRNDTFGVKIGRELVNDINRHAQVVLDGIEALREADGELGTSPLENAGLVGRVGSCVVIEDLRGETLTKPETLSIKDPSKYFLSDRITHHKLDDLDGSLPCSEGIASKVLKATNPTSLPLRPLPSDVALKVLLECSRGSKAYFDGLFEDQGSAAKAPDVLPHELVESFRREALAVNELCRMYWQHTNAGAHRSLEVKHRALAEINKRYVTLNDQRKAATGPERTAIRNLLKPLLDMIDSIDT